MEFRVFVLQEKRTALHFSAQNSHVLVVEALIRLGANVNVEVSNIYTLAIMYVPSQHH